MTDKKLACLSLSLIVALGCGTQPPSDRIAAREKPGVLAICRRAKRVSCRSFCIRASLRTKQTSPV